MKVCPRHHSFSCYTRRWQEGLFFCDVVGMILWKRFLLINPVNALYHYLNVGKTSSICWSWLGQRNFQQVWKSSLHQVGAEILLEILITVSHTMLMMLVGRIWPLINLWSLTGIFLYCLLLLDVVIILWREILSWSLMEIKGLTTVELAKLV